MANIIKVRLKDATGDILHPETDWSVVQNKPSIFTYPKGAGTCIGDVSGFRIFYVNGRFYVCVTADIADGDYTLGFATPGGTLVNKDPIIAFFVNIMNLNIDNTGIDSQHLRLNLISGNIDSNYALGVRGRRDRPLLDELAASNTVNVPVIVNDTLYNTILPDDDGGALCIGMFRTDNITYDDIPYLMMVTKRA